MNFGCQLTGTGYVDLPGWALNFTGPLSLVLWVKADPAQGITQCIAGKGTGAFRLLLDGQGYPHFADGEQSSCDLVGTARIDDGMWHQIAGIYDGANTELLYVDGQLAASTAFSTNAVTGNTNEFLIGSNPDGEFFQLFNGVVDEVCIFTNALTAIQLGQLFSARLANVSTPPLFQSLTKSAGTMLLSWTAEPGRLYQVQYKIALTQTSWSNLGIPFAATNHTASISDVMTDSQRFYRVILLP